MIKKIFAGLFFVVALLALIGSIINTMGILALGLFPKAIGYLIGSLIAPVLYILSGFFLLFFDRAYKMTYAEGFKLRIKQNVKIILFTVIYGVLTLGSGLVSVLNSKGSLLETWLGWFVAALPYLIPVVVFAVMLAIYVIPFGASKKRFVYNDDMINEYLSAKEELRCYSDDHSVLANKKVIFMPKLFVVIPMKQIASVKFVNTGIEQDVVFKQPDGQKLEVVAGKKKYEAILRAIDTEKVQ